MRTRFRSLRVVGTLFLAIGVVVALVVALRSPSLDRRWDEDVRVLTGAEMLDDGAIRLDQVRNWRYTRDAVVSKAYFAARYDPAEVEGLWLYEQELGLNGLIAHTFLVFEFPERYGPSRWLGLSVETRREPGESYSLLGGLLRKFEVTHIWATEEDLVTRRVEFLDYPLSRYRVAIEPELIAAIFRQFVHETVELASTPRWYNTIRSNCTNSLIRYVNKVEPGAIPWHYSSILTGRADTHLVRLGYVDADSATSVTRPWLEEHRLR